MLSVVTCVVDLCQFKPIMINNTFKTILTVNTVTVSLKIKYVIQPNTKVSNKKIKLLSVNQHYSKKPPPCWVLQNSPID